MKLKKEKKVNNLYIGDLYARYWYPSHEYKLFPIKEYELVELGYYLFYKNKKGKYIMADDLLKTPAGRIKLYLTNIVDYIDDIPVIKLCDVDKPTLKTGKDGILGKMIDEDSLKKIKKI